MFDRPYTSPEDKKKIYDLKRKAKENKVDDFNVHNLKLIQLNA